MVGLPPNPDPSFLPAAIAGVTVPLSQAEREEKEKRKKKGERKKPNTNSMGNTFENNISLNKECAQGSGGRQAGK